MARSPQSEDQVDHVANRTPIAVTTALKGMDFPASKAQLIAKAKQSGAHEDTLNILQNMPEGTYDQMADVTHNMPRGLAASNAQRVQQSS